MLYIGVKSNMQYFDIEKASQILLVGDAHLGSLTFKEKLFKRVIEYIRTHPNVRVIFMGDLFEGLTIDDKRYQRDRIKIHEPLGQLMVMKDILEPIKGQIVCILEGNHEHTLRKFGNLSETLSKMLGVGYGTSVAVVRVQNSFDIFVAHGSGSMRHSANDPKVLKVHQLDYLKKKLKHRWGSSLIMACGHYHKLLINEPDRKLYTFRDASGKNIKQGYTNTKPFNRKLGDFIPIDERYYVCTGSFKGIYELGTSGWEEDMGFDANELGYIEINVENGKLKSIKEIVLE
jgi:hypothetical protein